MRKLRVGLVGCGYIAPANLVAWEKIAGVEVVALCDKFLQRASKLAKIFEVDNIYRKYSDMFSKERLDIVDITSSLGVHAEIALAAANDGIHVLCQKPFARNLQEAQIIVDTCQKFNVKLMVHQNFRFQPFSQHVKKMIDSDVLGNIFYCRIFHRTLFKPEKLPVATRGGEELTMEHQPYYVNAKQLVLMNMVIHHLDTARYLLGEPSYLNVLAHRFRPYMNGENHVLALLDFNDKVCYIEESWVTQGDEQIGFRIEGEKGSVEITNESFRHYKSDGLANSDSLSNMFPGFNMNNIDNYSFLQVQQHFVDCIMNDKLPITNGEDNLKTLNLVFKGYESIQAHQTVKLD